VIAVPVGSTQSRTTNSRAHDDEGPKTQVRTTRTADGAIVLDARSDPRPKASVILLRIPPTSLHELDEKVGDNLDSPTPVAAELVRELNDYRARHGMRRLPWSRSLSHVAALHARDLNENPPAQQCMIHSWSNNGPWSSCCYQPDHSNAECMWNKPRELSRYTEVGFELVYMHTAGAQPDLAVRAWRESPKHRAVLLNRGKWADNPWRAMGVGISGDFAVVWFGEAYDPAGYWVSEVYTVASPEVQ
jgi:uncharacterized protein YkwD